MQPDENTRLNAVKDMRQWLDQNRALYLEMKKRLDSPKATRQMLLKLRQAMEPILSYNPANEPHVAVFIIAQVGNSLEGFFQDLEFAEHYEEKQEEMKELKSYDDGDPQ